MRHSDVRVRLIRRTGKHTGPRQSWMRQATIAELLDLDFNRISASEQDTWETPVAEPLLLVCAKGRRDRYRAVWERPRNETL